MATNWSMYRPGTTRSWPRLVAVNPLSSRPSPAWLTATTWDWAQWWLVRTSPCGDTNDAEQPGIRSDASRARRYHASSGAKP